MPQHKIDGRVVHYEIQGPDAGPPAVVMGGWGTFCHTQARRVPRAVIGRGPTLIFDYRGIGESTDSPEAPATTSSYAADLARLLDHLGWERVDVVGLVGMGACVGQQLALSRPELVRSLAMTGTWARPDPIFRDQLEGIRRVHTDAGFDAFQLLVASFSFAPDFYNANRDRLIGRDGVWSALNGRADAHSRLVDACLAHDTLDLLGDIDCPTLVVHAGRDVITRPDMTRLIEHAIPRAVGVEWDDLAHVVAGKAQHQRLDEILTSFFADVDATALGQPSPREKVG